MQPRPRMNFGTSEQGTCSLSTKHSPTRRRGRVFRHCPGEKSCDRIDVVKTSRKAATCQIYTIRRTQTTIVRTTNQTPPEKKLKKRRGFGNARCKPGPPAVAHSSCPPCADAIVTMLKGSPSNFGNTRTRTWKPCNQNKTPRGHCARYLTQESNQSYPPDHPL